MKEIRLLHGEIALVDDADYPTLANYKWRLNNYGYAVRSTGNSKIGTYRAYLMHREVLGMEVGEIVDHINLNKLDNRRANLRTCTAAENARHRGIHNNKTGFIGVTKRRRRFKASITVAGQVIPLGNYDTARQAARAYDAAARTYHGAFASQNFDD